ncbi:MAG: retropepsin-like aspartic protease [Pseudomonadota bacterium]
MITIKLNFLWLIFIAIICYLLVIFTPFQVPETKVVNNAAEVTVRADPRGHFLFHGEINDHRVNFFYDTGATLIVIPEPIAKRLGLRKGRQVYSITANGRAVGYETNLKSVRVGNIEIRNVEGRISPSYKSNTVLLGLSFLNHIEIQQAKGLLTLRAK